MTSGNWRTRRGCQVRVLLLRGVVTQLLEEVVVDLRTELIILDRVGDAAELAYQVRATDPGVVLGEHVGWGEQDVVAAECGQVVLTRFPGLRLIVEDRASDRERAALVGRQMRLGERLRVLQQITLDEVRGEVADVVTSDSLFDERKLLQVGALGDRLRPEPLQYRTERVVERAGKVLAEPATRVAEHRESEPVLLHLLEHVPGLDEPRIEVGGRPVAKEHQVANHSFVKIAILRLLAVEEEKGVDEKWQVRSEADVEGTVVLQNSRRYSEML